jgi:hypothetical protein
MKSLLVVLFALVGAVLVSPVQATAPPSKGPFPRGALVRYVVLGDSVQGQAPFFYADYLERDLGVRVQLDEENTSSSSTSYWLKRLKTDKRLQAKLRRADVITLNLPLELIAHCDPRSLPPAKVGACNVQAVKTYRSEVEGIFDALVSLRSPSKALIRATDHWQFGYRTLHKLGIYNAVKPSWQAFNAIVHKVAARYRIPVAHAYAAMNGANGNKDPIAAGYVSHDEVHLIGKGTMLLAKLYRNLGYRLAKAPS